MADVSFEICGVAFTSTGSLSTHRQNLSLLLSPRYYVRTMARIVLFENIHQVAVDSLLEDGHEVERLDRALPEDELIEKLKGVDMIGIRSKTKLTPKVLEAADSLLAVGAFCIGTNQVALDVAQAKGIPVFNAPFSNTRSVAELVIAEIVMLSRKLGDRTMEMHQGKWRKSAANANEVRGKTLGIIGYGHIGRQVGVLAEAFGMRVLFFDVLKLLPMGNNQPAELDGLLEKSDFVTLHVPETPQTKLMFTKEMMAKMKKGAHLLNLSRGSVVDIPALADAIKAGHIAGAGIDVFPKEPAKNISDEFESELCGVENVVMTPHIGGSTQEAQENIGREVSATLSAFAMSGRTFGAVNFPQANLPTHEGGHRICHVHRNKPGVLRDVNRILASADANIQGQFLATEEEIGYLILDCNAAAPQVVDELNALESTIRVRALY